MTSAQLDELLRDAEPSTADDVTITWDGRRLDTKEKLLDWLREIEPVLADLRARGEIMNVPPRVEHDA